MENLRIDRKTGKRYTYRNIPLDTKDTTDSIKSVNGYFKIFSMNHDHPDDSWYNGVFIGERYGVCKWVSTSPTTGFFQQVSNWYMRFGNAQRIMYQLAEMEEE